MDYEKEVRDLIEQAMMPGHHGEKTSLLTEALIISVLGVLEMLRKIGKKMGIR